MTFTTHIRDMEGAIYTDEPSNSKNMCFTPFQKTGCPMSSNMSQHRVKHHYHCINLFYSIPPYCCKLYGRQPQHQHMYSQWNGKSHRHHQQARCDNPTLLIHSSCASHKNVEEHVPDIMDNTLDT